MLEEDWRGLASATFFKKMLVQTTVSDHQSLICRSRI